MALDISTYGWVALGSLCGEALHLALCAGEGSRLECQDPCITLCWVQGELREQNLCTVVTCCVIKERGQQTDTQHLPRAALWQMFLL